MSDNIKPYLTKLSKGQNLLQSELAVVFEEILNKEATPSQIGAFLMGLERVGLSDNEIIAGAKAMRHNMISLDLAYDTIDVCGTGGDGAHSLNISTAVSFVLAGCGLKVAKHGNRSMSSLCGAADVLEALGVKLRNDSANYIKALDDANLAFFFAPNHHPKLAYVGPIRKELGFGTVFNVLGPLCNPTKAKKQLLGVYRKELMLPIANALKALGTKSAWVIHGADGLDEIAIHGITEVISLKDERIESFSINPKDYGFKYTNLNELKGGDAKFNAKALIDLLEGKHSAYRDAVVLNSAAALCMAGNANDIKAGIEIATSAIDTHSAKLILQKLIEITNE